MTSSKTILLIEKDDYERKVLSRSLMLQGHVVLEASDEMHALEILLDLSNLVRIDHLIDFDIHFRGHIIKMLMMLCLEKFKFLPVLISDNQELSIFDESDFSAIQSS